MSRICLPRNVHFVYEHALAQLELREGYGLHLDWDPLDPWQLTGDLNGQHKLILNRAAYVGTIDGEESVYAQLIRPAYRGGQYNRTRSENQYLTHWIYPYKGKFHPQMIRGILNGIGARPGWTVADVFSGSGTTLLECEILGIHSVGIDVSPLCVLLAKVKTESWGFAKEIEEAVSILTKREAPHPDNINPRDWGTEEVARFIEIARMVTYSDSSRRKRDPRKYFGKNLANMLHSVKDMARAKEVFGLDFGDVRVSQGDCRDLQGAGLEPNTIDAIVTSPPYTIALDYVENDEHALKAMGYEPDVLREEFIGLRGGSSRKRVQLYEKDMTAVFHQMGGILKPGARAVIVIGNVTMSGKETVTTDKMVGWAEAAGLRIDRQMDKIVWGLYNMVKDEKIMFFTKR